MPRIGYSSLATTGWPRSMCRSSSAYTTPGRENDLTGLRYWNAYLLSSREAMELRQADLHMGGALRRLLPELGITGDLELTDAAFAGEFAHACVRWDIPLADAAAGYAWTWFEARVAAAIKLVPLGQTAGQRILYAAAERIGDITARGLDVIDADIGASAPALAIGSCLHEQQYSRLFRS